VVLSISQGIHQQNTDDLQKRETENAFSAVAVANSIFHGTVHILIFTNEFVTDDSNGQRMLRMIRDNKRRANEMGVRVGTRSHTCGEILGGHNQGIIIDIVKESDFTM